MSETSENDKQYVVREKERMRKIIKEHCPSAGLIRLMRASDFPEWQSPKDGDCFGPWRFQQSNLTLQLEGKYARYHREIDLEELSSSEQLLNTLHHNLEKVWGNPDVMGNLLVALFHLANCWWGDPKLNLTDQIRKRYGAKAVAR